MPPYVVDQALTRAVAAEVRAYRSPAWGRFISGTGIEGRPLAIYDRQSKSISVGPQLVARIRLATRRQPHTRWARNRVGEAVFILAHEAAHARGVQDEQEAYMQALRDMVKVGVAAGIPREYATWIRGGYL